MTGFYDEATGSVQYLVADPITRAVRSLTRCSTLIQRQAPLREITPEHYDRVFALNTKAPLFPRAEVAADDGQWRIDHPRGLGYALHGPGEPLGLRGHQGGSCVPMSRTWAAEFKDSGIRANTPSPGVVDTPMLDDQANTPEDAAAIRKGYATYTPMLQNSPIPTSSPAAALFLASDESSFMTGSDMVVDGGVSNV